VEFGKNLDALEKKLLKVSQTGSKLGKLKINAKITGATEINKFETRLKSLLSTAATVQKKMSSLSGFNIDTSKATSGFQKFDQVAKKAGSNINKLIQPTKNLAKEMGKLATAASKAAGPLSRVGTNAGTSVGKFNSGGQAAKRYGRDLDGLAGSAKAASEAVRRISSRRVNSGLRQTGKEINRLKRSMDGLGRSGGVASGILTRFFGAAAAIAALRGAIRTVGDFEEGIASLSVILDKGSVSAEELAGQLSALRDQAARVARDTTFTPTEAVEGLVKLTRAGLSAGESLNALRPSTNLAQGGLIDLEKSTKIITQTMKQFNLTSEEATTIADKLTFGANNANTDVLKLSAGLSKAGVTANQFGVGLSETIAAVSKLQDAGVQADRAGTGISRILLKLSKPSKKATETLDRLGLSADDLNVRADGLVPVLEKLGGALKGNVSDAADIVDQRFADLLTILTTGSKDIQKSIDSLNLESAGKSAQAAAAQYDTLNGALSRLGGAFGQLAIAGGDSGLLGSLKAMVSTSADLVQALAGDETAIAKLSGTTKTLFGILSNTGDLFKSLGVAVAAFASVSLVRGLVGVTASVLSMAGAATTATTAFGALAAVTAPLLVAVGALGLAYAYFSTEATDSLASAEKATAKAASATKRATAAASEAVRAQRELNAELARQDEILGNSKRLDIEARNTDELTKQLGVMREIVDANDKIAQAKGSSVEVLTSLAGPAGAQARTAKASFDASSAAKREAVASKSLLQRRKNDLRSRIGVGETLKNTVGFGSDSSRANSLEFQNLEGNKAQLAEINGEIKRLEESYRNISELNDRDLKILEEKEAKLAEIGLKLGETGADGLANIETISTGDAGVATRNKLKTDKELTDSKLRDAQGLADFEDSLRPLQKALDISGDLLLNLKEQNLTQEEYKKVLFEIETARQVEAAQAVSANEKAGKLTESEKERVKVLVEGQRANEQLLENQKNQLAVNSENKKATDSLFKNAEESLRIARQESELSKASAEDRAALVAQFEIQNFMAETGIELSSDQIKRLEKQLSTAEKITQEVKDAAEAKKKAAKDESRAIKDEKKALERGAKSLQQIKDKIALVGLEGKELQKAKDQIELQNAARSLGIVLSKDSTDAEIAMYNQLVKSTTELQKALRAQKELNRQKKIGQAESDLAFEEGLVGKSSEDKDRARLDRELRKDAQSLFGESEDQTTNSKEVQSQVDSYVQRQKVLDENIAREEELRSIGEQVGQTLANGLYDAVTGAESLRDSLKGVLESLSQIAFQKLVTDQLSAGLGNMLGGTAGSMVGNILPSAQGVKQNMSGGVVNSFSSFSRNGQRYSMSEGGTAEGILPLKRNKMGQLGVHVADVTPGSQGGSAMKGEMAEMRSAIISLANNSGGNVVMNMPGIRNAQDARQAKTTFTQSLRKAGLQNERRTGLRP
jgi:TP901 family phage tail tape measure protein